MQIDNKCCYCLKVMPSTVACLSSSGVKTQDMSWESDKGGARALPLIATINYDLEGRFSPDHGWFELRAGGLLLTCTQL